MSETRAPYLTDDKVVSDSDTMTDAEIVELYAKVNIQVLRLFWKSGITPRRLLMLAQACERAKSQGWARVVMLWVNSLPELLYEDCLLYTSPSPRDRSLSRMPSSA